MIISASRWIFLSGPEGEWTAIHIANLAIFVGTYMSFLCLLQVAQAYLAEVSKVEVEDLGADFVFVIGTTIFLLLQLLIGNVSRVGPDLLVSGFFFLTTALCLKFNMRPSAVTAIIIGFLMGLGYVVKAAFLPISAALFLVVLLHILARPRSEHATFVSKLIWALPAFAIVAIPYIAINSTVVGFITLGETGSLNYAWNVNHLPAWTHWQGGPPPLGVPIHPTQLVSKDPHVFVFAEPFHVTYPPWFDPFYWYQGYHRYFSIGNQLAKMESNFSYLRHFFLRGPRSIAVALVVICSLFFLKDLKIGWKRLLALWPFYLPSILAVGVYVLVVIEPRYMVGFLIVILTAPFLALFVPTQLVPPKVGYAIVLLVILGSAAILTENQMDTLHRFIHRESYTDDRQWKLGLYLAQSGLRPGDKVASVGGGMRCTWAYISGARIVSEIGANSFAPEAFDTDFERFTHDPEVQRSVFDLFRKAGATLVVAIDVDGPIQGEGWQPVPGTKSWIHRL